MNFGLIGLAVSAGLLILVATSEGQHNGLSWGGYFLDNGTHYLLYQGPQPRPKPRPRPNPVLKENILHPNFGNISSNPFINYLSMPNEFPNRIVGGVRTNVCTECPFLCSVHQNGYFICGCVLVTRKWCLTAHHCIGAAANNYAVRCGSTQQRRFGQYRKIQKIVANKGYNANTMTHDLAMMKFKTPMKLSKCVKTVKLPAPSSRPLPKVLTVWGWGLTSANAVNVQRNARKVKVDRLTNKQCNKDYAGTGVKITSDMVCASRPGKDSCSGDSGGPMTHKGVLVGLVSFGIGCANRNYPGVYCRVVYFIKWILSVIRNF